MAELPYRQEHVDDAIADSDDLTNEQLGAYVRLQRALWRAGGYLPVENLPLIARGGRRWGKIAAKILKKLTISDGVASCQRTLELLLLTRERRRKAVARAKAGGAAAARSRTQIRVPSEGVRSARNVNENNGNGALEALVVASFKRANQNQEDKDSKSLPKRTDEGSEVYTTGVRLLTERVGLRALAARAQIAKWLQDVGDEGELQQMFQAAEAENLQKARLVAVLDQRVRGTKTQRERGSTLNFGLTVVSKRP